MRHLASGRRVVLAAAAAGLLAPAALAWGWVQPDAAPATGPAADGAPARKDEPPITIGREDLARAYLRLERALAAHPKEGEAAERANREFDAITGMFFTANFAGAVDRLSVLTRSIEGLPPAEGVVLAAETVKVVAEPPVAAQGRPVRLRLGLVGVPPEQGWAAAMAEGPDGARVTLVLCRVNPDGGCDQTVRRSVTLDLAKAGEPGAVLAEVSLDSEREAMLSGRWLVRVSGGRGGGPAGPEVGREAGAFTLIPSGSLDAQRNSLLAVLDSAGEGRPELARAIAAARSRAGVLTDRPSSARSAEILFDLARLADDVEDETRAILKGRDPYRRRAGDWWRQIGTGRAAMGVRIYAPRAALEQAGAEGRLPLIIALHGAGGDEHMFMDGYGGGAIKHLADQHGFIVASAATAGAGRPAGLDALIDTLSAEYPIDPARVTIVGHSMGAMAGAALASSRGGRLAGVACLAGGPMGLQARLRKREGGDNSAPMLVIAAANDPIIPLARLKPAVERAREGGSEIELRIAHGLGHTLMVGPKLPEAVEWLLARRR